MVGAPAMGFTVKVPRIGVNSRGFTKSRASCTGNPSWRGAEKNGGS